MSWGERDKPKIYPRGTRLSAIPAHFRGITWAQHITQADCRAGDKPAEIERPAAKPVFGLVQGGKRSKTA